MKRPGRPPLHPTGDPLVTVSAGLPKRHVDRLQKHAATHDLTLAELLRRIVAGALKPKP